jgi:hypothetical protein
MKGLSICTAAMEPQGDPSSTIKQNQYIALTRYQISDTVVAAAQQNAAEISPSMTRGLSGYCEPPDIVMKALS